MSFQKSQAQSEYLPLQSKIIIYPFVKLVFPLALGILLGKVIGFSLPWLVILFVGIFTLVLFKFSQTQAALRLAVLFFLIFLFGIKTYQIHREKFFFLPTDKKVFIGLVDEDLKLREKTLQTPVRLLFIADSNGLVPMHRQRVLIAFRKDSVAKNIFYGDTVIFQTSLQRVKNFGNPYEFDYKSFLAGKGIFYSGFADSGKVRILGIGGGNPLLLAAHRWRQSLLRIYQRYDFPMLSTKSLLH